MSEGVDVRPEDLRRGAGRLRDDGDRLGAAASQAANGVIATASAAGDGPLAEAADALAARLQTLLGAVSSSVTDCADALAAASTQYLAADDGAATGLGGSTDASGGGPPIVVPGLEPPR